MKQIFEMFKLQKGESMQSDMLSRRIKRLSKKWNETHSIIPLRTPPKNGWRRIIRDRVIFEIG